MFHQVTATSTLILIGGAPSSLEGAIYCVPVIREDADHIIACGGVGTQVCTAAILAGGSDADLTQNGTVDLLMVSKY